MKKNTQRINGFRFAALLVPALFLVTPTNARENYEWTGSGWEEQAKPAEGTPEGELALVRHLYENGEYRQTVKAADKFVKRYGDHEAYEEVCLIAGRAEMERGRYFQGYEWFEKQLDQFPAGRYSDRALELEYQIAEAFLAGKKRIVFGVFKVDAEDDGLEILQRIAQQAPGTEIAARSLLKIADHLFAEGEWLDAAQSYDVFLELFGKTEKAPYAMLQAARAMHAAFRGVAFDETPLLEAEQRYKTFAEMYPRQASEARVAETLEQIKDTRAEKLYLVARFYERTHRPSAAVYYYQEVLDDFPDTQWARDSQQALVLLGEIQPTRERPEQPAPEVLTEPIPLEQVQTAPSKEAQE